MYVHVYVYVCVSIYVYVYVCVYIYAYVISYLFIYFILFFSKSFFQVWPGLLQIQIHKAKGKQRRNLIQEEVRASVEEKRRSKIVGLCRQGAWTWWENFAKRKISWADIWHADASRLKFLVQSVYDVLPSPANLFTWGKSGIPSCPLCAGKGTLWVPVQRH